VTRSAGCTAPVVFTINPATGVQIISQNDSAIRIRFTQTTQVLLKARIETPCAMLEDSLQITVFDSPDSLNLGPDINLCSNSTVTLSAGPGFKTYRWSDGTTDSIFTTSFPGTYHVAVEDYCGNTYRDTITINVAPNVPFDLGADLVRCNDDTLTITAPPGFTGYTWAANYNISAVTGQSVRVWPAVDTVYTVVAEKAFGCLVFDTVRVRVYRSPIIQLGNDTSFCAGGSITLNAGTGFAGYTWSTGAATQTITVTTPGTYWVEGTTAQGCRSRDSLLVLNVFANPVVNLGADTSLCQGSNLLLNAGNPGASYLWQNGATIQTQTVNSAGLYWVQVTATNGCTARDSMVVLAVLPNPVINLGNDTSFCAGTNILLNAGTGFASYIWSTGATTQTINVNTAGTYWVEGTTAQGCKARDTMNVLNVFALPVVNLGVDTSFCQGYTHVLNAGNPGANYLWQNGATTPTISVTTPGLYWVQVTNANGCSRRDSMRVLNVFAAPVVNLGNDTSFCAGGSITLNAGNPGSNYLWQNGATTQTITTSAAGLYWVAVTNGNNCTTRDSMRVLAVHPLPNINLGGDTVLCNGNAVTLDPGPGYAAYLWQNGATTQTISVSAVGTYWVRVTTANGCTGSDTIRVVRTGITPSGFVAPTVGMCLYENIFVRAQGNFNSYLWSTGETRDSALIVRPGNYWLQVTNNDGCSAREDFIVFDKNCPEVIYFPTGFSPTKDGINDVYKPALYGVLLEYRMEIYNRFGERVFFTTDPAKGWDGTYKGTAQGVGAFVWMCRYRFKDKDAVFRKGTLVLVR
ncbi:MAG: gliding motility-associated C-terminal domain-containing protein, partial [Dinghuibacter sp.]|nr:gliding motility-associated C-terminal domain-containing protein [Dinghuibacter sp.]